MSSSIHIIASKELGGAENFYQRLLFGLKEDGESVMGVVRNGSKLQQILKDKIELYGYSMFNNYDIFTMHKIKALIREKKPQVVQTYMSRATALTRVPKKEDTVHIARLGGYYDLRYFRHADYFVGNTKGICNYLISNGFDAKRVFWISNFVEFEKNKDEVCSVSRESVGIPKEAFVIMALGRFIHKKGFDILIEAFANLKREIKERDIRLLLVGDGNKRDELKQKASSLEVDKFIYWAGWQTDTAAWFKIADLFVCPSREEPLGNVILEGWANKLPVVATKTDGAKELIEDGKEGLIVDINPLEMSEAIKKLIKNRSLAEELSSNGFQMLMARHSKEAIVRAYKELYKSVSKV